MGSPKQPPASPASVIVFPSSATLADTGARLNLRAVYRAPDGTEIPGQPIAWVSLNPAIATVDSATGVVTAHASGQVTIEAFVGGHPGYALLTIAVPSAHPVTTLIYYAVVGSEQINAVWGADSADVYAAGANGTLLHNAGDPAWDPTASPTVEDLFGVWGTSRADMFAVGNHGAILHNNGSGWIADPIVLSEALTGVWGSAPNDVFAVGTGGTILHYDSLWSPITSPTTASLRAVWGTSSTNVYAVGDGGVIIRYDGTSWSDQTSGVGAILLALWGTSAEEIYAVGAGGTVLRYDGSQWTSIPVGTQETLYAVWGTSSNDVYVAGANGVVLRFDGVAWTPVQNGGDVRPRALWGTLSRGVVAAGERGVIATGTLGGAAKLVFASLPTSVAAGTTLDTVEVWVVDALGRRVTGATDQIWLDIKAGPDTVLLGTITALADSGKARFTDLRITVAGPGYVLRAYAGGLGSWESPSFSVTPGPIRRFRFLSTPGSAVAGVRLAPAVRVVVEDSFANPVIHTTTTVGIGVLPAGTPLNGINIKTSVNGIATFDSIDMTRAGIGYRLAIGAPGIAGDTSPPFDVVAGPVEIINISPDGATISTSGGTQVFAVTAVFDGFENPITGRPVTWTSLNPAVAAVDPLSGLVTAVGAGQSAISAQVGVDPVKAYGLITVSIPGQTPVTVWDSLDSKTRQPLQAVTGTSATNVFAVGDSGTIRRFNGTSWSIMASGLPSQTPLRGVWAASPLEVFAVGGQDADTGVFLRYQGTSWAKMMTTSEPGNLRPPGISRAVWGSSPTDVYAVGEGTPGGPGVDNQPPIMRYEGDKWKGVQGPGGGLFGVWGAATSWVYVAGANDVLGSWSSGFNQTGGGGNFGVWGTSSNDVFAAGDRGINYWNGTTAIEQYVNDTLFFKAIGGTSSSDVYAVGDGGIIYRFDGSTWTQQPSPTTTNLNAIWVAPTGEVFVVGDDGLILRGRR